MNGVIHNGRLRDQGFTLIELLAVVAIMAILMAITIPAFENMGRSSAVRTAATQVSAALTFARQQAVVSGVNTYVIFPNGDNSLYSGLTAEHREKAFRSYAVFSEKDGYIRPWSFLPKGILFIPTESEYQDVEGGKNIIRDTKSIFSEDASLKPKVYTSLPFPDNSGSKRFVRAIAFSPDGQSYAINGNLRGPDAELYLSEGFIDPALPGSITPQFRNEKDSGLYMVSLNPLTGQNRILDVRAF